MYIQEPVSKNYVRVRTKTALFNLSERLKPFFFVLYFNFASFTCCIAVRRRLRDMKHDISDLCKKNYELEKDVQFFDQRIALLINHRISVEVRPKLS